MSFTRLQTTDPDLVRLLRESAPEALRRVAYSVARACLECVGLPYVILTSALARIHDGSAEDDLDDQISDLVAELDRRTWEIQDRVEAGIATQDIPLVGAIARQALGKA